MKNIFIVIKHEIRSTLCKPAFWITTFVLPIIIMAFSFGAQFVSMRAFEEDEDPLSAKNGEPVAIGYVDHADLIRTLPENIPAEFVWEFPDQVTAQQAMEAGELRQYYIIEADYLESGELLAVDREFSPLGNLATIELFRFVLNYNLVGDQELSTRVSEPVADLEEIALDKPRANGEDDFGTRFVIGFGTLFIFFFVFTMSSSYMLRSVSREKENRTVEILLVSLRPRELMLGKTLGLGLVALLQITVWAGGSYLVMQRGDGMLSTLGISLVGGLQLPEGFVLWAILYFILGYVLYSSILGAIGALAPNARETGQFTFIALLPLMIPMWINNAFINAPNGGVATALSIFPLTAPTSMLPRLATGSVPIWQPLVSLFLLTMTTYIFVLISARFFRADTLLSSASLSWRRFVEEFKKPE